jgi:hypothetical protein
MSTPPDKLQQARETGLISSMLWRVVVPLCLALATAACDHFVVSDFAGSRLVLTIHGASATPAGQHLELWARTDDGLGNDLVTRLLFEVPPDLSIGQTGYSAQASAYTIAQTVDINDPCMIDDNGNLLWKPEAQTGSDADKMHQAMSVEQRIHQLTDLPASPLLALVSYDDAAASERPQQKDPNGAHYIAPDADAPTRLDRCKNVFWARSPHYAYTGNPNQLTAPVHGQLFGMLDFQNVAPQPPQIVGGINIETRFGLHDLREIWFTQTPATVEMVDPKELDCAAHPQSCRGTLLLQGDAGTPNKGIYHFELSSPLTGVSGSAAVYTRLDEDSVQF